MFKNSPETKNNDSQLNMSPPILETNDEPNYYQLKLGKGCLLIIFSLVLLPIIVFGFPVALWILAIVITGSIIEYPIVGISVSTLLIFFISQALMIYVGKTPTEKTKLWLLMVALILSIFFIYFLSAAITESLRHATPH